MVMVDWVGVWLGAHLVFGAFGNVVGTFGDVVGRTLLNCLSLLQ
jgi:hypothetical protein